MPFKNYVLTAWCGATCTLTLLAGEPSSPGPQPPPPPVKVPAVAVHPSARVASAPDRLGLPGERGNWQYTWPFGELGEQVPGFKMRPFEGGGTMRAWGQPCEFHQQATGATVAVWCMREQKNHSSAQPFGVTYLQGLALQPLPFHQLPAGRTPAHETKGGWELTLAFQMGERVFRIDSQARTQVEAERAALLLAESIYQFRSTRQPQELPH